MSNSRRKGGPPARRGNSPQTQSDSSGIQFSAQFAQFSQFTSPLPPADELERLERLCPGITERMVVQLERQGSHRRALEATVIPANIKAQGRGQTFAWVVIMTILLCAFVLGLSDHEGLAVTFLGIDMVSAGGVFFVGRSQQAKERVAKATAVPDASANRRRR